MSRNVVYDTLLDFCKNAGEEGLYMVTLANSENIPVFVKFLSEEVFDSKELENTVDVDGPILLVKGVSIIVPPEEILTPPNRCKGLIVYSEYLENNGIISMTARGCVAPGQDILLKSNDDGTFEYIPAQGGLGAAGRKAQADGSPGISGVGRQTGGGGAGSAMRENSTGGNGSAGTSYSGGSGGGGMSCATDITITAPSAEENGGSGGAARGRRTSGTMYVSSGGAGNPSGRDARPTSGANTTVTGNAPSSADEGTGGLLIIYSSFIVNNGVIESRGSSAKPPVGYNTSVSCSGGSSGGGSINIFYTHIEDEGIITAAGGVTVVGNGRNGGNGGDGTVTLTETSFSYNLFRTSGRVYTYSREKFKEISKLTASSFKNEGFSSLNFLLEEKDSFTLLLNKERDLGSGGEYRNILDFSKFENVSYMEVRKS